MCVCVCVFRIWKENPLCTERNQALWATAFTRPSYIADDEKDTYFVTKRVQRGGRVAVRRGVGAVSFAGILGVRRDVSSGGLVHTRTLREPVFSWE